MLFPKEEYRRFSTQRLLLRPLNEGDASFLFALRTNQQVNKYLDRPVPEAPSEMQEFIIKKNKGMASGQWLYWAMEKKSNLEMIGTICLWNLDEVARSAEVGYELHPDHQRQGYMTEALACVIEAALMMGLSSLSAFTSKGNTPSKRLLEKMGFSLAKTHQEENSEGRMIEMVEYRYDID